MVGVVVVVVVGVVMVVVVGVVVVVVVGVVIIVVVASFVQVQAWMGHADIKTTMRYLHHKSRADDARLLSAAFEPRRRKSAPGRSRRGSAGSRQRQAA